MSAHPLSTSAVRLDVGEHSVTATVDLPLDQLGVATGEDLTAADVLDDATVTELRQRAGRHVGDEHPLAWRPGSPPSRSSAP